MIGSEEIISERIAIIILAAGSSSRFGSPKQLLSYHGQTLIKHSLQMAIGSRAHPIIVVLGANADKIENEIENDVAHVVVNEAWQEGMSSSIRLGIESLLQLNPFIEGAILMVCDQPFVNPDLLNNLIAAYPNTGKPIVTCSYAGTLGTPTLFHKTIFPELLQLSRDVGAKSILKEHINQVEVVQFPEGSIDIDTEADYKKLAD